MQLPVVDNLTIAKGSLSFTGLYRKDASLIAADLERCWRWQSQFRLYRREAELEGWGRDRPSFEDVDVM